MNGESQDQHAVIAGVFVSLQIQIHISVGLYLEMGPLRFK